MNEVYIHILADSQFKLSDAGYVNDYSWPAPAE
jgi:hypothetical protein